MADFDSDEDADCVIPIASDDFWVKIIDMLQQNWALVETGDQGAAVIHFIGDTGGVFDALSMGSQSEAEAALRRNGFMRLASSERLKSHLSPPKPPYVARPHPNGPIYSSGRYWITALR
ncbi:hypothetical protein AAFN86_14240 [Roseomonas sp. CAU 1739]|uniref:hypothetical protein n=1 Tax=Roseomonas sp. CAU 1739 TaxID=3140364 RepID=UPI00325BC725